MQIFSVRKFIVSLHCDAKLHFWVTTYIENKVCLFSKMPIFFCFLTLK